MISVVMTHPSVLLWISLLGVLLTLVISEYLRPYVVGEQNDPLQRTSLRLFQFNAILLGICLAGGLLAFNALLTPRLNAPPPTPTATLQPSTSTPASPAETAVPQVIVVATSTPAVPSATPLPQARIVNTNDLGVNVRARPSTAAQIVEVAAEGAVVDLLGDTSQDELFSWVHIRLTDGQEGWVVSRFLEPLP